MQFWDTAGQDKYKSITGLYFKGTHGAVLIYDITDLSSFKRLEYWATKIKRECAEGTKIVVIGNKADLERSR